MDGRDSAFGITLGLARSLGVPLHDRWSNDDRLANLFADIGLSYMTFEKGTSIKGSLRVQRK